MSFRYATTLPVLLRLFALVEFVYFSLSHWFVPTLFFSSLGITPSEVASPFVRSQLQLIGVLVMGYALLNLLVAADPRRQRGVMAIVLIVGAACVAVFVGHVFAGTLPMLFSGNAVLLSIQILLVAWMFPWSTSLKQASRREG